MQKSDLFVVAMKPVKAGGAKGGDGLRRTGPRQLSLAFADSPSGGGSDACLGRIRAAELSAAKSEDARRRAGPVACAVDTSRLLEEVASEANLARALLNVIRNKGAPGRDGQTVEEAEAQAPAIIDDLRRALLVECYRPGEVRRVLLPKPGGGQRGLGIPNVVDRVGSTGVCSRFWSRSSSRRFIRAVTVSVQDGVRTQPSLRSRSICKPGAGSWSTLIWKNFSIEFTISDFSTALVGRSRIVGWSIWCA